MHVIAMIVLFVLGYRGRVIKTSYAVGVAIAAIVLVAFKTEMAKKQAIARGHDYIITTGSFVSATLYAVALLLLAWCAGVWVSKTVKNRSL